MYALAAIGTGVAALLASPAIYERAIFILTPEPASIVTLLSFFPWKLTILP